MKTIATETSATIATAVVTMIAAALAGVCVRWAAAAGTGVGLDVSRFDSQTLLLSLGGLLMGISYLWFIVSGFRVSVGWGMVILIFPFLIFPFAVSYPALARRPVLIGSAGIGLLLPVFMSSTL